MGDFEKLRREYQMGLLKNEKPPSVVAHYRITKNGYSMACFTMIEQDGQTVDRTGESPEFGRPYIPAPVRIAKGEGICYSSDIPSQQVIKLARIFWSIAS